jgi:catechol 2,3-dioxygenase-like lactoylglutathione lyase family enzyme
MTIQRMDNVGIVVEDLDAAIAFFTELGMERKAKRRSRASGRTAPSDSTASAATSR